MKAIKINFHYHFQNGHHLNTITEDWPPQKKNNNKINHGLGRVIHRKSTPLMCFCSSVDPANKNIPEPLGTLLDIWFFCRMQAPSCAWASWRSWQETIYAVNLQTCAPLSVSWERKYGHCHRICFFKLIWEAGTVRNARTFIYMPRRKVCLL